MTAIDSHVDADREALRSSVRDLLEDLCSEAQVRAAVGDRGGVDERLWTQLGQLGVIELAAGSVRLEAGASWLDLTVLFEELGRALAPVPALSTAVALTALDAAPDDLAGWAADVASGARRVAVAVAVGDDLVSPANSVSATADGLLTGRLPTVLDASGADAVLVLATTANGSALYLVGAGAGTVTSDPVPPLDLTQPIAEVVLDGAQGQLVAGPDHVVAVLRSAWLLLAAEQVGVAQRALDSAVAYAKTRSQFGRTIGSFQAVKHACVDMLMQVEGGRELVRAAAASLDAGDADQAALDVSLAAAYASEAAVDCAQRCLQIHGGIGFTWEHGAHLMLRKAKSDSVRFGNASAHWQAVTRALARRATAGSR